MNRLNIEKFYNFHFEAEIVFFEENQAFYRFCDFHSKMIPYLGLKMKILLFLGIQPTENPIHISFSIFTLNLLLF